MNALELYRHQYRLALGKSHGAGSAGRDLARHMARIGFFIARRVQWQSWDAFWERATRGLDFEQAIASPVSDLPNPAKPSSSGQTAPQKPKEPG